MHRPKAEEPPPPPAPRNLEEDFILTASNLASDDSNVQAKRKELANFNFRISESIKGLDLVSGVSDKRGETYYGFVLIFL